MGNYGDFPVDLEKPKQERTKHVNTIIAALIGAAGLIIAAFIGAKASKDEGRRAALEEIQPTVSFLQTAIAQPQTKLTTISTGTRLEGNLTDRSGTPISGISVSIQGGPETITDGKGKFVLIPVPNGDQMLVVKSSSGKGQLTQNIYIDDNQNNSVNIVYDAATGAIGLLSISAPASGESVHVTQGQTQIIKVTGRCDGLAQVFGGAGNYEIWILIRSLNDPRIWVQRSPAIVDSSNNTWQASAVLGSAEIPPKDGEQWFVVAVAASVGSGFDSIPNVDSMSQLPPNISSNVVTIQTQFK